MTVVVVVLVLTFLMHSKILQWGRHYLNVNFALCCHLPGFVLFFGGEQPHVIWMSFMRPIRHGAVSGPQNPVIVDFFWGGAVKVPPRSSHPL